MLHVLFARFRLSSRVSVAACAVLAMVAGCGGDGGGGGGESALFGSAVYPREAVELTAGDFNDDGNDDLLMATPDTDFRRGEAESSPLLLLLGDSLRTMVESEALYAGAVFRTVDFLGVADLDDDGNLDFVSHDSNDDVVTIHFGDGDGAFPETATIDDVNSSAFQSVAIADFTGDELLDLVVPMRPINSATPSVTLFTNDGMRAFAESFDLYTLSANGTQFTSLDAGDFNGDAIPDVGGVLHGRFRVYLGNGDGTFQNSQPETADVRDLDRVALADFNGDDVTDLVADTSFSNNADIAILMNDGNGVLTRTFLTDPGDSQDNSLLVSTNTVRDYNDDGNTDFLAAGIDPSGAAVLMLGNGDGTFEQGPLVPGPSAFGANAAGDFDGNGALDIATSLQNAGVQIVPGLRGGEFATEPQVSVEEFGPPWELEVADMNNDGDNEIVVLFRDANTPTQIIRTFENTGDEEFVAVSEFDVGDRYFEFECMDVNGDLFTDIVAVSDALSGDSFLLVLLNDGMDGFDPQPTLVATTNGIPPIEVRAARLNADAIPDLVVIAATFDVIPGSRGVFAFLGTGTGFTASTDFVRIIARTEGLVIADLNGDTFDDVAANVEGGSDLHLWLSNGDGTFADATQLALNLQGGEWARLAAADLNADGLMDLAAGAEQQESRGAVRNFETFLNAGNLTFTVAGERFEDEPVGDFEFVDIDLDLFPDEIAFPNGVTDPNVIPGNTMQIRLGNGDGTFATPEIYAGKRNGVFGDVTGDGYPDLVSFENPTIYIYRNGSNAGSFP